MFVGIKQLNFNPGKQVTLVHDALPVGEQLRAVAGAIGGLKYNLVMITNARLGLLFTSTRAKTIRSIPLADVTDLQVVEKANFRMLRVTVGAETLDLCGVNTADAEPLVAAWTEVRLSPIDLATLNPQSSGELRLEAEKRESAAVAVELLQEKLKPIVAKASASAIETQDEQAESARLLDSPITSAAELNRYLDLMPNSGNWTKMPSHLKKAITSNISLGEKPQFVITESTLTRSGALVGMNDRLILIKSGVVGGFMAGSLGGARVATFYHRDITGVEYNTGFRSGVVEILTASYSGTANKDYWRGKGSSRNADANDPWTLSNTLPLSKSAYAAAKIYFDKIRESVAESKNPTVVVNVTALAQPTPAQPAPRGLHQLRELADLRDAGIITEAEFAAKKTEILARM